jgi:hypothetical protein
MDAGRAGWEFRPDLASEVLAKGADWNFVNRAPKFATRPLLVITSDDGLTAPNDAFVDAVKKSGNREVNAVHIPTDHSYSDHRIALQQTVLDGLARLRHNDASLIPP